MKIYAFQSSFLTEDLTERIERPTVSSMMRRERLDYEAGSDEVKRREDKPSHKVRCYREEEGWVIEQDSRWQEHGLYKVVDDRLKR